MGAEYIISHDWSIGTEGGKWGFIDNTGREIIPAVYDFVRPFRNNLAAVRLGDWETGKFGYIDKANNIVVPFELKTSYFPTPSGRDFSEGLIAVRKDGSFLILEIENYQAADFAPRTGDNKFMLMIIGFMSAGVILIILTKKFIYPKCVL